MKSLIVSIYILGLVGMATGISVWSATEGTISATVTGRNLSINRTSDGIIAYGTLNLSATTTTDPSNIPTDTETFNNDGSTARFNIQTSGATGGTAWSVGATAASDTFVHSFTSTTATGWNWQILQTVDTYETASSSVDATANMNIYMKLDMPTASTDYVQKTITVTVQAAAP